MKAIYWRSKNILNSIHCSLMWFAPKVLIFIKLIKGVYLLSELNYFKIRRKEPFWFILSLTHSIILDPFIPLCCDLCGVVEDAIHYLLQCKNTQMKNRFSMMIQFEVFFQPLMAKSTGLTKTSNLKQMINICQQTRLLAYVYHLFPIQTLLSLSIDVHWCLLTVGELWLFYNFLTITNMTVE